MFGESSQNHVKISHFQESAEIKKKFSTQPISKKVKIKIDDDSKELLSIDTQKSSFSKKSGKKTVKEDEKIQTQKKRKKTKKQKNTELKDLMLIIKENNILLKDLNQHFKTLHVKLRNLTEKPIKIEIIK